MPRFNSGRLSFKKGWFPNSEFSKKFELTKKISGLQFSRQRVVLLDSVPLHPRQELCLKKIKLPSQGNNSQVQDQNPIGSVITGLMLSLFSLSSEVCFFTPSQQPFNCSMNYQKGSMQQVLNLVYTLNSNNKIRKRNLQIAMVFLTKFWH